MSREDFGFGRTRWWIILIGTAALGVWASSVRAQVGEARYDTTFIPLEHTASTVGDSRVYRLGTVTVVESYADKLVGTPGDSVKVTSTAGFPVVPDSVVTITSSSTRGTGIRFDTSGAFEGRNGLQADCLPSRLRIKAANGSPSGFYISFMIKIPSSYADTVTIAGLSVRSVDTVNVSCDSTTTGSIQLSQIGVPGNTTALSRLVALPGLASRLGFGPASRLPHASQTAGNIINSANGGTALPDTGRGVVITFLDKMDNPTPFGTAVPEVRALLSSTSAPGSGVLGGASATHWYGKDHVAVSFDGLSYVKAEKIDLEFTLGTFRLNTITSGLTSGITVAPGSAAYISASITSKDEYTVDDTKKYNLVVTDKYRNSVNPTWIQAKELTSHGGVFTGTGIKGDSILTGTGSSLGETAFTFNPGKYYVGRDTLLFIARSSSPPATHYRSILITPGDLGGIIADYSGTANGSAITEKIAAGEEVYVRAFLQDAHGNPIDADAKSGVSFAIGSELGKNMSLDQSAMILTDTLEESQYLNCIKTAVGVAIPYRVSTNVRSTADTVIAACENYKVPVLISVRSCFPARIKMAQAEGADSSVVASGRTNAITFCDTVWDRFGNLVDDPGSSSMLEPKRPSFAVCFSSGGLVTFADAPGAAKLVVGDTLYPTAGIVRRPVYSCEKAGVDTLKSWPASNPSSVSATPVWVTPAAYSRVSLTSPGDSFLLAGETRLIVVEKQDAYGNHIDWGMPGGNHRLTSGAVAKPSAAQITADSAGLHADTVTTGHNRGGKVTCTYEITGKPGVASVGGSLAAAFPFTACSDGPDTQAVYVKLVSGNATGYDTLTLISAGAGVVRRLQVRLDTTNALRRSAGDSVRITVTALDSLGRRVFTYGSGKHALTLNRTAFEPIAARDTTHHFTFLDVRGRHVRSTGETISDTVFRQGEAVFYLHKFAVDSITNTVSVSGNGCCDTSETAVLFLPLPVDSSYGYWSVDIDDTSRSPGPFTFIVTPRDKYYNINSSQQVIVNILSNETGGIDFGSNPKVVQGPTTFYATSALSRTGLIVYIYDYTYSHIYGQGAVVSLVGIRQDLQIPKVFGLSQNYPNPFNPTTTINYQLTMDSHATLRIYDVLGREVETLVNARQSPGSYTVKFEAGKLSSGVYFYRLKAGNFTATRKMLIIK